MIILLTGEPGSGKSTVAEKFTQRFSGQCHWVLTDEIFERGRRTGYEAKTWTGEHSLLAHITAIDSGPIIGSHEYHVNAAVIDQYYTKPLLQAVADPPALFVLDEIGNMQRLSPAFKRAVSSVFAHNLNLLATIRTRDKWTTRYRRHPYAVSIAVTPATRELLPGLLVTMCDRLPLLSRLRPPLRQTIVDLSRRYAANDQLTQLAKLYGNALTYLTHHRVETSGPGRFIIQGDHGAHHVSVSPRPSCDCNLFNGRGRYHGRAGECSHLMAARLQQV